MERGKLVAAQSRAAILEIKVQIGRPQGISDDFVEFDGAAVRDKGGLVGRLRPEPRNRLVVAVYACAAHRSEGFARLRVVDHER